MKLKILLIFGLIVLLDQEIFAQKTDYKSYAVYLMSFVKYADWADPMTKKEVRIACFGKSKINQELSKLASSPQASGRKIKVVEIEQLAQIEGMNMVFVADNKSSSIKALSDFCKQKSILIVTEREGLAKKGAAIHFTVSENDDLSFEVNPKQLISQQIKIAQRLLQLGKIVE